MRIGAAAFFRGYLLDVIALHHGRIVGKAEFDEKEVDNGYKGPSSYIVWLGINVLEEFQHRGIGSALVEAAVEIHGMFRRPTLDAGGGNHVAAEDFFMEDGAALVRSCIKKGILQPDPVEDERTSDDGWE